MGDDMANILNCPFCGSVPNFPEVGEVYGTFYDAGCEDCGVANISLQISDCFERPRDNVYAAWDENEMKYSDDIIKVARDTAIEMWNTRK